MRQIYSVLVENRSGVLSRIAGLFSRRGFNIDSLAVGVTEREDTSRMTIVSDEGGESPERTFEQIRKQLSKMIDTVRVKAFTPEECIIRELVMVKLFGNPEEIKLVCDEYGLRIADESDHTVTVQIIDTPENICIVTAAFAPFKTLETVRTGVISLQKGSKTLLE